MTDFGLSAADERELARGEDDGDLEGWEVALICTVVGLVCGGLGAAIRWLRRQGYLERCW